MKYWVKLAYSGICGSWRKVPHDWADRITNLTNLIIAVLLSGIIIKLGLRFFGLNNPKSHPIMTGIIMLHFYLMLEKIGFKSKYILSFNPQKTHVRNNIKDKLSFVLILLIAVSSVPFMIFLVKIF
jgi:hypothetical protein